jgi:hypothetical protein
MSKMIKSEYLTAETTLTASEAEDSTSVSGTVVRRMISDTPYRTSTQYRFFSYASADDLLSQRTKANSASRDQLPPETDSLSVTEEIELVNYYVSRLWDFCRLFKVPSHVKVILSC